MSRITLVTSTDEHLADLPPGFRKDDYRASVLAKLEWQGMLARRVNARAVLRGGDFFHVKPANKTTHATVQMAAAVHRAYPCDTFAVAGNHDMSNNDPSTVLRQQPLGVMFRTGVFKPLRDETFVDGTLKVRVVGVEYTTDLDLDALQEMVSKRDDDVYTVAVVHALAANAPDEKVQSFFNERIFDYRDLVFKGCPDAYVFGHYHKDQGVQDVMGVKFVNLGSVSRGALTFENMERKPKVSLLNFSSQGLYAEEVVIPHGDASDVFDLSLKQRLDTERKDLNEFISKLRSDANTATQEDRRAELDSYPDELRALALQVLEAAEAGVLEQ